MTSRSIRVLLVDDHWHVLLGLESYLGAQPGFEVAGQARSAEEALPLALELRPDVALVDIRMPGAGGLWLIEALRGHMPECRAIVLTQETDPVQAAQALRAGAAGYLLKDVTQFDLAEAIRLVAGGKRCLHPEVERSMGCGTPEWRLTGREQDVLRELVAGYSNKEIAKRLDLKPLTVKSHMNSIRTKLGVRDRTGAALLAAQLRLN